MQTGIIEIIFLDGRKFYVNFENAAQKSKLTQWYYLNKDMVFGFSIKVNGIHSTKQFLNIINNK